MILDFCLIKGRHTSIGCCQIVELHLWDKFENSNDEARTDSVQHQW